jgi:hypothetical protein
VDTYFWDTSETVSTTPQPVTSAPESTQLPKFLNDVYPEPGANEALKERICIDFNAWTMTEMGYIPNDTENIIKNGFELSINDNLIYPDEFSFWDLLIYWGYMYEKKEVDLDRRASLIMCTKANTIEGSNVAIMRVSINGKPYSYTWSFGAEAVIDTDQYSPAALMSEYVGSRPHDQ